MQIPDIIIAIDGYSSTGKSSFAKIVANEFSFLYLDSGALYRGVTLFAIENGFITDDCIIDVPGLDKALESLDLHFGTEGTYIGDRCIEQEIRSLAVADKVSPIATVAEVRDFVDRKLREFGNPTAEEAKEKKLCQLHEKRKKLLQKGQFACRKYCLNRMDQLEQLEKRLKEMKDGLKKIELELGEDAESKAQKLKL